MTGASRLRTNYQHGQYQAPLVHHTNGRLLLLPAKVGFEHSLFGFTYKQERHSFTSVVSGGYSQLYRAGIGALSLCDTLHTERDCWRRRTVVVNSCCVLWGIDFSCTISVA